MNPAAWVERHARRRPDDPALADGDRVYASWGEFATRTAGAANGLRDHFGYKWALAGFEIVTIVVLAVTISLGKERRGRSFLEIAEAVAPNLAAK